jgi:predicted transcriptional regulator
MSATTTCAVEEVAFADHKVYGALAGLGAGRARRTGSDARTGRFDPFASIKPDYIVCLEDGKKLKMLKRHLMTHYNMTPGCQYRARWNLPADYPMVAPNYAEKRRELAKKIGLGRKPGAKRGAARKAKTPA